MEQVLCEPVELTEFELDAVAGGNPFQGALIIASSFAVGAISGDFSDFAFSTNAGQVNTLGTNVA